jgi:hypothetical protein
MENWVRRNVDLGSSNEEKISRCLACVNAVMPSLQGIPRVWAKLRTHTLISKDNSSLTRVMEDRINPDRD